MKILQELTARYTLQAGLKKGLKPCGTFADVFGNQAEEVADAVHDKVDAQVYCLDTSTDLGKSVAQGIMNSPEIANVGTIKVIRLGGSNRAIVSKDKVYVGDYHKGRLIEGQE